MTWRHQTNTWTVQELREHQIVANKGEAVAQQTGLILNNNDATTKKVAKKADARPGRLDSGRVDPQRTGSEGHGPVYVGRTADELSKESFERFAFNEYKSRQLSVNRTLPEVRNEACVRRQDGYGDLPRASVIICFVDEAWSVLMRSVWSVVNRSPPELLAEVLLVDDSSGADWFVC